MASVSSTAGKRGIRESSAEAFGYCRPEPVMKSGQLHLLLAERQNDIVSVPKESLASHSFGDDTFASHWSIET